LLRPASSLFAGTQVNSGQSLFTIDGSSMAENNLSVRIAEAESEYNRAKAEYERKELLAAERIASESELNQAMAEFKRAEANYNNLSRNFKAGSQQVSSPISGYINELLVKNGQFVNAGEPVMTISRNNRLIIQTELQSRYYDQLDNINSANFRILNSDKIFSLDKIAAGNILYSRSVDLNNPLITLTIQLDKGEDLLPGSMVDLYLKTDGNMSVITVPNESIVEEMGNYFVFVQQTPELFEKRPVLIGVNDGRRTEIKEGVLAGERVIAKGAVLVKLSQSAGAIDVHSGHVH
jgi:cobalt-zinc-cadmium efflux system membrane fusion protein